MSNKRFYTAFLRAVDFGFESLGKSCKKALYFHLENSFNVRPKDVVEKVERFDEALKLIFKDGATYVERLVLEKLCEELGVKFEESYVFDFAKAVSEIEGIVSEEEHVLIMSSSSDEEGASAKKRGGGERVGPED